VPRIGNAGPGGAQHPGGSGEAFGHESTLRIDGGGFLHQRDASTLEQLPRFGQTRLQGDALPR
jgi:hypothetical protein